MVMAGIAPLTFLTAEIGGSRLQTAALIPPGQDPHTFEPSPGQVSQLSRAKLYFSLDMPFERLLLSRLPNPEAGGPLVIEVGRGIKRLPMPDHHHDHQSSAKTNHHGEPDPHIWLAPPLLQIIAADILDGLLAADPAGAADYQRRHDRLQSEIAASHERIQTLLAPLAGRAFYVYHPAFGYFAETYGLRQLAVEIAGKAPTPRQLINLAQHARREEVRVIFVQPQFDRKSAAAMARAIDGQVTPLDPMAADVLDNLETMARTIHQALNAPTGSRAGP